MRIILLLILMTGVAGADDGHPDSSAILAELEDATVGRVIWINPPELQTELDELRAEVAELREALDKLKDRAVLVKRGEPNYCVVENSYTDQAGLDCSPKPRMME